MSQWGVPKYFRAGECTFRALPSVASETFQAASPDHVIESVTIDNCVPDGARDASPAQRHRDASTGVVNDGCVIRPADLADAYRQAKVFIGRTYREWLEAHTI